MGGLGGPSIKSSGFPALGQHRTCCLLRVKGNSPSSGGDGWRNGNYFKKAIKTDSSVQAQSRIGTYWKKLGSPGGGAGQV